MRKFFTSLIKTSSFPKQLGLCKNHISKEPNVPSPIPYKTDQCLTCATNLCHVCSDPHLNLQCDVKVDVNSELGVGKEKDFNLGRVMKVDLRNLKCICGKPLRRNSAICAACGLASCSQACHQQWEKAGMCNFKQKFYSTPDKFTMRSITFHNIHFLQNSQMSDWAIANKSSTSMISCYASNSKPYVFLQRGYRSYGRPNVMEDGLDFYTHYERRCSCSCHYCLGKNKTVQLHPHKNCRNICLHSDFEYLQKSFLSPELHEQCNCNCSFCQSGIIVSTHQKKDCYLQCPHSSYNTQEQ